MLGLGLTQYIPYIIYGLSFFIAFFALFYRSGIGILFLVPLLPVYSALNKVLKSDLPLANNVPDMLIIAMLMGWMLQGSRDQKLPTERAPLLIPILLLSSYTFLSFFIGSFNYDGLFSETNMERLAHWKNYMIMPLLYLICYYTLKDRKWQHALFVLLAGSMLAADYKFKLTFRWYKHTHFFEENRLGGTFAFLGPNEWGSFHAIYVLFFIGLFLVDKHFWRRIAYVILILGGGYAMMYSYSRGAYMGFLIGLFVIALVRSKKLLIPLIIFLFVWKSVLPNSVVERIEMTFVEEASGANVISVGDTHVYTAGRAYLWEKALDMFYQNPITGLGYNTFQRSIEDKMDTHSLYFKTLAEQGLIGLTILLWLYFLAFRSGWRLYKGSNEDLMRALGFGFFCAALGYALVNLFGDRWTYFQLGGVFWVLWALVDQENSRLKIGKMSEVKG